MERQLSIRSLPRTTLNGSILTHAKSKNALRWESFINYLEGLGKIRREEPKITSTTMYLSLDNQKMTLELPDSDFSPLYLTASKCIIDSIKVTTTGLISNVKFKGILIHFVVIEFEATLHEQSDGNH